MKTLLSIVLAAFVTVAAAQEKQGKRAELSPDQMADLKTKKMALALDLNESQQKDLLKLNKELVKRHMQKREKYKALKEKGEKLSSEQRYDLMNSQLEEKLEVQRKMKKLLTEEQYQQWRKMSARTAKKKGEQRKRQMRMKKMQQRKRGW